MLNESIGRTNQNERNKTLIKRQKTETRAEK